MPRNVLRIGNVEVVALIDATASAGCSMLFPQIPADDWKPFDEHLTHEHERTIPITISSFVVRSNGKTIVVDTGIGGKPRRFFPTGRLPDALGEAGVRPGDVDVVIATHIHIDHVGWHTVAQGDGFVPLFPNATHVFNREEFEYFTSPDVANARDRDYVRDSVLPLIDVAKIDLVDGEHRVTDELTLLPTPGHTPAHVSIGIVSGGEAGVIIGDVCHHPAQMVECGWSPIFDMNPVLAAESREKLMQRIEDERMIAIAGHFAHPGFGRLVRVDGKRTWRAL
jgi:glyoxylase-like metal-dependent hydrolase (beta-lactamase superfamily II)